MALQQASFYCPQCQQQRLFTRQEMNHTPHILASVFLCGLWLPVWFGTAFFYNARFHCAQCGFFDAVKYLKNPNLRQQEAQQAALRQPSTSIVESFTRWFSALSIKAKALVIILPIIFLLMITVIAPPEGNNNNKSTNTVQNSSNTVTSTQIASTTFSKSVPSSLSPSENLASGKKALSDGDLSTARNHLSAIPKDAKEFASAKQYLATVENREKRKVVEDELKSVESEQASVERTLNATEDYSDEGTLKKNIYLNALKRKGELQLRYIQLERKLKSMP